MLNFLKTNGKQKNKQNKSVYKEMPEIINAAESGNFKDIKKFVNARADINYQDSNGLTAIMLAAHLGYTEIVEFLIEKGANINLTNKAGWTALMAASQQGHDKIVSMLIDAGTNLSKEDENGWNALSRAYSENNKNIVTILKKAGAKLPLGIRACEKCGDMWKSSTGQWKDFKEDGDWNGNITSFYSVDKIIGLTCTKCKKSFCVKHLNQPIPESVPGGNCPDCGSLLDVG